MFASSSRLDISSCELGMDGRCLWKDADDEAIKNSTVMDSLFQIIVIIIIMCILLFHSI
ncbi:mCG1929 [Mus musculus]|nr:mCG1929 [Mus musculus]